MDKSDVSTSSFDRSGRTASGIRAIRRTELGRMVPLTKTTIYELEKRGEFPRRFHLPRRCVVWDLAEVEEWLKKRRQDAADGLLPTAPTPDVRLRRTRPVKGG